MSMNSTENTDKVFRDRDVEDGSKLIKPSRKKLIRKLVISWAVLTVGILFCSNSAGVIFGGLILLYFFCIYYGLVRTWKESGYSVLLVNVLSIAFAVIMIILSGPIINGVVGLFNILFFRK